jgi:hypothetical protein
MGRGLDSLRITEQEAAGEDAVYCGTKLWGDSNKKATNAFGFNSRRLE